MSKCIDLTGQTFGNLWVIQRDKTKKGRQHYDKQSKYYSIELIQRDYMKQQYCKTHNIPLLILDKTNTYDDILMWYQGLITND